MRIRLIPKDPSIPEHVCNLINVSSEEEGRLNVDLHTENRKRVFANIFYQIEFLWTGEPPAAFYFFINDEPISGEMNTEKKNTWLPSKPLFLYSYGFVQIELACKWKQGDRELTIYRSEFLEVMVHDNSFFDNYAKIFEYVGQRYRNVLYADPSENTADWNAHEKSFQNQMQLLEQIENVYERYLSSFRTNPHSTVDTNWRVDDFEKIRYISPRTLDYIVRHPEELSLCDPYPGIQINGMNYLPRKTLIQNSLQSADCFENAVVLGFLNRVIKDITRLMKRIDDFISRYTGDINKEDDYLSSAEVMMQVFLEQQLTNKIRLKNLRASFTNLYWIYKSFLPIEEIALTRIPNPTSVFQMKEPYRQVYEMIIKWFNFGDYEFQNDGTVLPFMTNSSLYEHYVLLKLTEALENRGFRFSKEESTRFQYICPDKRYRQTKHINTFIFHKDAETTVTLFYQPVIFGKNADGSDQNGISLRRTTSLSWGQNLFPGFLNSCYTPDFILKFKNGKRERFLIADAKFREFSPEHIFEYGFKYQFSIQPTQNAELAGIVLFYGKNFEKPGMFESVQDLYENMDYPFFAYTSLTESKNCTIASQNDAFNQLFKRFFGSESGQEYVQCSQRSMI